MDSERLSSTISLLCVSLMLYLGSSSVDAYKFRVGGKDGYWTLKPPENYNHWSGRSRFQVNDTLSFKYKKESDSVLVVSKDDYEKCNTAKPIIKFQEGDSTFKFDRSGPFYFITGNKSNCDQGQKLLIVVLAVRNYPPKPPLAPAPAIHAPSGAPTPSLTPVPSPATHSPVPSPVSQTPVPSPVSQAPEPSPAGQAPVPSPSSYNPVPSPVSQTPVPSPASYTPVPSPVSQAPEPSTVTYTPVPSPDSQAPVPYPAPLAPSPSSEGPVLSPANTPPASSSPASSGTPSAPSPSTTSGNTPADISSPPAPAKSVAPGVTSPSIVLVSLLLSVALGGFVTSHLGN